ncbi:MAG: F0F1 ATP synthase subunit A [Pyrinomonadaceae bacterium]|nr:F0F1 ATP synthase subunit A [Pyrinomonadaceae bacterium]
MFLLFAEEHEPIIVEFVNRYFGEYAYHFNMEYVRPYVLTPLLGFFGTTPDALYGKITPENAIPWYTIMFFIACLLTMTVIWVLRGRLSEDNPSDGQQTLEATVLTLRGMLVDIVGEHGVKYFPVVATFAILILISNLMGFFPLFITPTASVNVTFALGISSFIYYNYIGIKENGIVNHLAHLAGPIWWMAWLIFPIEVIGNLVRPMSLGIRLFGNMFADEQVSATIAGLAPPYTQILLPVVIMPLGLFVALIQTFVFTLLSMLYLSEVSHGSHDEDHDQEHAHHEEPHIQTKTVTMPA